MCSYRGAFTLVELLIVVAIIAILAILVLPKFIGASDEAREAALMKDLQMLRNQIEVFKLHHGGVIPDNDIVDQLLNKTDERGSERTDGQYGPYIPIFPTNPFTDTNSVEVGGDSPGGGDHGWFYNRDTGLISPDDDAHKDL